METQVNSILTDPNFWIELAVSGVALFLSFVVNRLDKNIDELFSKANKHGEEISSLKTGLENLRDEFIRSKK